MWLSRKAAAGKQSRNARTLLQRARTYIGAVKGPLEPKNTAAKAKILVRRIVAQKMRAGRSKEAFEQWRSRWKREVEKGLVQADAGDLVPAEQVMKRARQTLAGHAGKKAAR